MFNVNVPYKHIRLNDSSCRPFTVNDERFIFLTRIVNWLETWESHSLKDGKLSKQTFTSLRHACIVLPQIVNYLTGQCGYAYILTRFLQTDPLEHHFGLYRMMSGSNYHVSYLQILEAERRLKISNLLTLFFNTNTQPSSQISMEEFIQSFSPIYSVHTDTEIDIDPFLDGLSDVSAIECDTPTLQSLALYIYIWETSISGEIWSILVHLHSNGPLLAGKWGMGDLNFQGVIIPIQNDLYKWE